MTLTIGKKQLEEFPHTRFKLVKNKLYLVNLWNENTTYKIHGDMEFVIVPDILLDNVKNDLQKENRIVIT